MTIFYMAELNELVSEYCLKLISLDAPGWYLNPQFKVALEPCFNQRTPATTPAFAPNILAALSSPLPPSIDFFKTLPSPKRGVWAVYVVVLVDPNGKFHLYIGSGTGSDSGCTSRTAVYSNKTHAQLPQHVRLAYDRGYEFSHVGMLCWTSLPSPTLVPLTRLLFICLEGVFTCLFYSAFYTIMEGLWDDLMPWTRDSVSWGALNSHLPFIEGVGDMLDLSPTQLESIAAAKKQRTTEMVARRWPQGFFYNFHFAISFSQHTFVNITNAN